MLRMLFRLLALFLAVLAVPAAAGAGGPERLATDKVHLDRNGDGFQDVIVSDRKVHYDLDFDGLFDYTLVLSFAEYTSAGHEKYVASNCSGDVFEEITMEGLDELCAQDREEQRWFESNFKAYTYYHDGYGFLYLLADSPENDGRIAAPKANPVYDYYVTFNPDGTVKSVRRGDDRVKVASFDFEKKSSSGAVVRLPKIEKAADLDAIRATIDRLLEEKKGS